MLMLRSFRGIEETTKRRMKLLGLTGSEVELPLTDRLFALGVKYPH